MCPIHVYRSPENVKNGGSVQRVYLARVGVFWLSYFTLAPAGSLELQSGGARERGFEMMPVTGGLVCLATLTTTNAFVAPLAARYGTPLASSASQAALRMSSEGGDDTPLVFPRSSLAFPRSTVYCLHLSVYCIPLGRLTISFVGRTTVLRPTTRTNSCMLYAVPAENMSLIVCVPPGSGTREARLDGTSGPLLSCAGVMTL